MKESLKKNDLVTLSITDLGSSGEGIGKVDGFILFVKDALIGDTIQAKIIKMKKSYGYGRLMEVLKPEPAAAVRFSRWLMKISLFIKKKKSGSFWNGLAGLRIIRWNRLSVWKSHGITGIRLSFL